jgi:hypothetical protein
MRPGQISDVVESPFGFHLIQVERAEPTEVMARHILFAPALTDADREAARARADSVLAALRAGAAIDSLTRLYHDPLQQSIFEQVAATDLPPELQTAIGGALPGDLLGPVRVGEGVRTVGDVKFLARAVSGVETKDLKSLADDGKKQVGSGIVAFVGVNEEGRASIVVGVTADLTPRFDAVALAKKAAEALGGKGGGGRPDLAQAGGPDGSKADAALAAVEAAVGAG